MKITPTLIQKFLENQCTAAEAEAVARHLRKHPELLTTYLKSSWDAADQENTVPAGYATGMREAINTQIDKQARLIRFRWLAVAASLLIVVTAVWFFIPETKPPAQPLAETVKQPATSPVWETQSNTSAKTRRIKLEDGSVVKLASHATIKYQVGFGQQKRRDIYLEGEAVFDVAPDKTRPFTVYTKLFSTVALGTSFRVLETATACTVKLFHGKVLISPLVKTLKGWNKDIILLPGDEMKYNLSAGTVSINQLKAEPKRTAAPTDNNIYSNIDEGTLVFDNTPLSEVMKTLTAKYLISISYEEELLKGKYFSGQVLKGDSLSVLLNVIANMNGLQVIQKNDCYIITPSK